MRMAAYRRGGGVVPMRMYAVAAPCGPLSSESTVGQVPTEKDDKMPVFPMDIHIESPFKSLAKEPERMNSMALI